MTVNDTSPAGDTDRKGDIRSIHRALDVLEMIGASDGYGVSELARQMRLPVSTVHNILRTLTRRGYLMTHDGTYHLGPAITAVSSQWDAAQALGPLIRPAMQTIARTTGHAAVATVLLGHDVRMVGVEAGTSAVSANVGSWTWANPLNLATGRLLVAMAPRVEWEHFVAAAGDAEPAWDHDQWLQELETIRTSGYSLKLPAPPTPTAERGLQVTGIAFPVWAQGGTTVCAIGCAIPTILLSSEMQKLIFGTLRTVTADLTRRLGGVPPTNLQN